MYYPKGMKARVSPVQWSKPNSILAPTQDSSPGGRIQNHKRWPLHYHCTQITWSTPPHFWQLDNWRQSIRVNFVYCCCSLLDCIYVNRARSGSELDEKVSTGASRKDDLVIEYQFRVYNSHILSILNVRMRIVQIAGKLHFSQKSVLKMTTRWNKMLSDK